MKPKPSHRHKLLARIHIAKKALGLDDADYRHALREGWGSSSSAELDDAALAEAVSAFELQAQTGRYAKVSSMPLPGPEGRPKGLEGSGGRAGQLRKIERQLAVKAHRQGKAVSWAYAHGMAKHMYGLDALDWCDWEQLRGIIAALEKHLGGRKRGGKC